MIRFDVRVFAWPVCDSCGAEGPGTIVTVSHDTHSAAASLNAQHRSFVPPSIGHVGLDGSWLCVSCKTPAVEPSVRPPPLPPGSRRT